VRFLLHECLPPSLAGLLRAAGHECAHVYELGLGLGLGGQPDDQIMALADRQNQILISADTDFGELLANAPVSAPSVILLRRTDKRPQPLADVILANLEQITDDLEAGALIVISDTRIRTRRLPMKPSG
jgi:predicted nuclease of predicted toxin-antitoxin system